MGFEAAWLAARAPYDEAALDPAAVCAIRRWSATLREGTRPVVVDLGSGTGAALARVSSWLAPHQFVAYAVDLDATLLNVRDEPHRSVAVLGNVLEPLARHGGPPDGSVDLVVGHALADLVPLDRLAARAAALVRPGGLVHLALAYDGLTAFSPELDAERDAEMMAAFHRHMDRRTAEIPSYGGSTAGRRLGSALRAAGLEIVSDEVSDWQVRADDSGCGSAVLDRLIRFVVEAVREIGGVPDASIAAWETARRTSLGDGTLSVRVGHRDVLARAR